MKQTVVPAQITSIEDKITGNLTLNQLILLTSPIFVDLTLYILFPPFIRINLYKLIMAAIIDIIFWISAVRVKGKMLIGWWIIISKYNIRPRYYVFDKNTTYLRYSSYSHKNSQEQKTANSIKTESIKNNVQNVSTEEAIKIGNLITDTNLRLSFMSGKKEGLNVRITQVK